MNNYIETKNGLKIDLGVPAVISSFEQNENTFDSHTSNGKLKVFSVGKTQDGRVFTQEFSDNLISSLPGTPVVAYYDSESEDFLGHNDEQYVYGYVPEDAKAEYFEEDGIKWAVVDVKLFTEREDNIGFVANKIIGKAQSLELNPYTVDYQVVYVNHKLDKIVFTKGSFYGLSVLGDSQEPAFKGSGFFTAEKAKEFQTLLENYKNNGGPLMEEKEIVAAADENSTEKFEENKVENNDDAVENKDFVEKDSKEEEKDKVEEEKDKKDEDFKLTEVTDVTEIRQVHSETIIEDDPVPTESEPTMASEQEFKDNEEEDKKEKEDGCMEKQPEKKEDEEEKKEEKKDDKSESFSADSFSLTLEEKNELFALRKEKKMTLIDSFTDYLSENSIKDFKDKIDVYDFASLEKELKIKSFDENKEKINKNSSTFGVVLPTIEKEQKLGGLDRLVAENI